MRNLVALPVIILAVILQTAIVSRVYLLSGIADLPLVMWGLVIAGGSRIVRIGPGQQVFLWFIGASLAGASNVIWPWWGCPICRFVSAGAIACHVSYFSARYFRLLFCILSLQRFVR